MNFEDCDFDYGYDNTRERLLEAIQKFGIKQVDIARETGIHHSSLSLWLQGKIKGHKVHIEESIQKYLDNLISNKPTITSTHITKFNLLKGKREYDDPSQPFQSTTALNTPYYNKYFPQSDSLVPMKLDFELEGRQLKEIFLWDKNEPYLTIHDFANILIEEQNLPQIFEKEIVK
jgi:transcriptional regulator with XRE-family HTH domain